MSAKTLLALLVSVVAQGCALPIAAVIVHREVTRICPLPAYYDAFSKLERSECASDAQWAQAIADEAHEQAVEDRVDCLRSGECKLESETLTASR